MLRGAHATSISRRSLLGLCAGICVPGRFVNEASVSTEDLLVPDSPPTLARSLVVAPSDFHRKESLPVLVLLHGLGETRSPELGLPAWLNAYGLGNAWARLVHAPVRREEYDYLTQDEYDEINASLGTQPFRGLCVVCPFLPNPYTGGDWVTALARYAAWLDEKLLPAVQSKFGNAVNTKRAGIAGVSLGGFSAIEIFLRRPQAFATVGSIQGAFSKVYAAAAARRLVETGQSPSVYVATSTLDPYRVANQDFARLLKTAGKSVSASVRKGPHSQGWLREIGALDALLWHDRALR